MKVMLSSPHQPTGQMEKPMQTTTPAAARNPAATGSGGVVL